MVDVGHAAILFGNGVRAVTGCLALACRVVRCVNLGWAFGAECFVWIGFGDCDRRAVTIWMGGEKNLRSLTAKSFWLDLRAVLAELKPW